MPAASRATPETPRSSSLRLPVVFRLDNVIPKPTEVLLPTLGRDLLHLLGRQLETRHFGQEAPEPLLLAARSNRHHTLVNYPS